MKPEKQEFRITEVVTTESTYYTASPPPGGWCTSSYRTLRHAECFVKNLNYMYEQGWKARELAMRKQLEID